MRERARCCPSLRRAEERLSAVAEGAKVVPVPGLAIGGWLLGVGPSLPRRAAAEMKPATAEEVSSAPKGLVCSMAGFSRLL